MGKGNPKVYSIDSLLRGYSDFDKLSNLYSDLRKEVLVDKPIQKSKEPLVVINRTHRKGNYGWELHDLGDSSLALLEYFGDWEGYAHEPYYPPALSKAYLRRIILTLHNPQSKHEKAIEAIIARYPRDSKTSNTSTQASKSGPDLALSAEKSI